MTDLFLKVKIHQEQQLPFVLYCKPNSDRIIGLFQKNDHLYFLENYEEKGFVFAPFDASMIPYIPLEFSNVVVDNIPTSGVPSKSDKTKINNTFGKDFFEDIVAKAIMEIDKNRFSKVVLSRKEEVLLSDFDMEQVFRRMIATYDTAFRYFFYHPKIGTWLGATPEQFLKVNTTTVSTVALAGTQLVEGNKNPVWSDKEDKEQQFVTDYIVESLEDLVKEMTISMPYAIKAGNLWHIKTDISAKLKPKQTLQPIIAALHPTPAVCGLPKQAAKDFITAFEGYDREYYSGFLGELNSDLASLKSKQSDLFVNLRCMKILKDRAQLYMGCGITQGSTPEAEYVETVNKSMTMKRILSI